MSNKPRRPCVESLAAWRSPVAPDGDIAVATDDLSE